VTATADGTQALAPREVPPRRPARRVLLGLLALLVVALTVPMAVAAVPMLAAGVVGVGILAWRPDGLLDRDPPPLRPTVEVDEVLVDEVLVDEVPGAASAGPSRSTAPSTPPSTAPPPTSAASTSTAASCSPYASGITDPSSSASSAPPAPSTVPATAVPTPASSHARRPRDAAT
jgi:hypothetical protein